MAERYDPPPSADGSGDDCPYGWIGEWLCEYVDGTMDPSMQSVFEEYLQANPELAAHVERLCRTRALLSDCGCRQEAAERARARLHQMQAGQMQAGPEPTADAPEDIERQIEEIIAGGEGPAEASSESSSEGSSEGTETDDHPTVPLSAGTVAAVASAMTLMLGVGMVAGAVFFPKGTAKSAAAAHAAASQGTATEQAPYAPDRPAVPAREFKAAMNASSPLDAPWKKRPLSLKKMPMESGDSVAAFSSRLLVRQAGLNP